MWPEKVHRGETGAPAFIVVHAYAIALIGMLITPTLGVTQSRVDILGDPLPQGAAARLGTVRFRQRDGTGTLRFTPDGRLIVALGNPVCVWDAESGRLVRQLPMPHTKYAGDAIAVSHDGKFVAASAGSADCRAYLWELATGKELKVWRDVDVKALAFSPDDRQLAYGALGGSVGAWEVSSGKEKWRRLTGLDPVKSVAFSPDGRLLAAGCEKHIQLRDTAAGEVRHELPHPGRARYVEFAPNGKLLVSAGGLDQPIRLWDVARGTLARELKADRLCYCATFSPDGRMMAAEDDGKVVIWDPITGDESKSVRLTTDRVHGLTFSPDGKTLAVVGANAPTFYSVATGQETHRFEAHRDPADDVVFLAGDRTIATVSPDHTVRIWNVGTGRQLGLWTAAKDTHDRNSVFSANGRAVAFTCLGQLVRVATVETGRVIGEVKAYEGISPWTTTLSPDGHTAATFDLIDRKIDFWEVATGKKKATLGGIDGTCSHLVYSADGALFAAGGHTGKIRIWNVATGKLLHTLNSHRWANVDCVAFAPDGKALVTCANDSNSTTDHFLVLWDIASGREVRRFVGHRSDVRAVHISPDGKLLASGDEDGEIRLWDLSTSKLVTNWSGTSGRIEVLRFSAGGRLLAAANSDTSVLLWDVEAMRRIGEPRR